MMPPNVAIAIIVAICFLPTLFFGLPLLTPDPEVRTHVVERPVREIVEKVKLKEVYKGKKIVPRVEPHPDQMPIGAMTHREFEYIEPDMGGRHIDDMFGVPPENVPNDGKTFYPAAAGGRYWIFWRDFNCERNPPKGEKPLCDQKVLRTEYRP